MSQIVNITITSSGPDLGPYNISLLDDLNNIYPGPSGIPKSLLIPPGYTFTVDDNIVKVRLQSVNPNCPYIEFDVPPPPSCTCAVITNIDVVAVDVQFTNCYDNVVDITILSGNSRSICFGPGTSITATGDIDIVYGDACTPTGEGGIMVCPPGSK